MADSVESLLMDLLRRRLGQAGPWPSELYRFVTRMARSRQLDERSWLLGIEGRPDDFAALVNAATVGHTQFYRHQEHFDQLRAALPILHARSSPLRIWSAACSTGEEAWSLGLLLSAHGLPFQLLATDVNARALERARRGHYAANETRHLPGYDGKLAFHAPPALRSSMRFEVMALLDELPKDAPQKFDVIFCRNVLIYLEAQQLRAVWERLVALLAPWGVLAVAPVESLTNVPATLERRGPLGWLEPRALPRVSTRAAPAKTSLPPATPPARTPSMEPDAPTRALEEVGRHMAAGNLAAAEQVLQALLARHDDALAWFLLGESCAKRGAQAQARLAFERASVAPRTSGDADLDTLRAAAQRRARQLAR